MTGQKILVIFITIFITALVLGCTSTILEEIERPQKKGLIAFVSERDGNSEIYTMDETGANQINLTNHPGGDYLPAWSPDGKKIAFASIRDGNFEIYVMNADGSEQINLTNNSAYDSSPAWSPDGSHILFVSDRDGIQSDGTNVPEIYIVKVDGTNPTRVTNNYDIENKVSYSPKDNHLVLSVNRGNPLGMFMPENIFLMDNVGTYTKELADFNFKNRNPTWSPDGSLIAFESIRYGKSNIYIMNANGSSQICITKNSSSDIEPSWSPDGSHIVFSSMRDGNYEIFIMDIDGANQVRLTNNTFADTSPTWATEN